MAEIEKHLEHVKKFVPAPNEQAVAGIVRHLGIALRKRDSSLVAATDPEEMKRVRESWLKKTLGLQESDEDLDKAVRTVTDKMKGDRHKDRVTVYYLLAEHFNKLDILAKPKAAKSASASKAAPKPAAK